MSEPITIIVQKKVGGDVFRAPIASAVTAATTVPVTHGVVEDIEAELHLLRDLISRHLEVLVAKRLYNAVDLSYTLDVAGVEIVGVPGIDLTL